MKNIALAISLVLFISCKKDAKLTIEIHNDNTADDPQPWRFFKINDEKHGPIALNEIQTFETIQEFDELTIEFKHPDTDSTYHTRIIQVNNEDLIVFKIPF